MLIISGVNMFPSQVESIIMEFPEMETHYQLRVKQKGHLTALEVEAEAKPALYDQSKESLSRLSERISTKIQQVIGIRVPVVIVPWNSIARWEGKARRIIDERPLPR
jgi:phenylacetate-CoA ligase